ncbi:hypothetical protein [Catellatospora methionotrophica]|uniref:hypothetical protein n=1 Tax=Catellatospora methionotrophica TaxID=121620 RepID=UPI0033E67140
MRRDLLVIFQFLSFLGWLYLLLQLLSDGYRVLNGEPVQATLVGGPAAPLPDLAAGVSMGRVGDATVHLAHPAWPQRWLWLAATAPGTLVLMTALILVNITVHRARHRGPFTAGTITLLRWTGVVLWTGVAADLVAENARIALSEQIGGGSTNVLVYPVGWIFGGFICFVVAEMIKRGVVLSRELEAVI